MLKLSTLLLEQDSEKIPYTNKPTFFLVKERLIIQHMIRSSKIY